MSRDDAEDGENDSVKSPLHPRQNDPSNMARGAKADVPLLAIEATSDDLTDSVWQNYFACTLKVLTICINLWPHVNDLYSVYDDDGACTFAMAKRKGSFE